MEWGRGDAEGWGDDHAWEGGGGGDGVGLLLLRESANIGRYQSSFGEVLYCTLDFGRNNDRIVGARIDRSWVVKFDKFSRSSNDQSGDYQSVYVRLNESA